MFFTRIPIAFKIPYSPEILNKSQIYFPLVGTIIGLFTATILWGSSLLLPLSTCIILSMIASILLTGAFHEDGLADVCDSFGGGYGKEQILTIMKDSRVGAYGVISLILILLLKFNVLTYISEISFTLVCIALINAHTTSRFYSGLFIYTQTYVSDIDKSKSKPMASKKLPKKYIAISAIFTILPLLLYPNFALLYAMLVSSLGYFYLSYYFKNKIGGYTGDCLGTVQQICEVLYYLTILVVWKYM